MAKAENIYDTEEGWETLVQPFGETFPFENKGDTLVGTFVSVKQIEQEDLQNPGTMRSVNVYTVRDADGKEWTVWGSYNVDAAFEAIKPGNLVRIQYVDTVKIDGGKREVKQFVIQTRAA